MSIDFSKYLAKSDGTTLEEHTVDVLQAGFRCLAWLPMSFDTGNEWYYLNAFPSPIPSPFQSSMEYDSWIVSY